jgi:ketosteroid isomerase-like protein
MAQAKYSKNIQTVIDILRDEVRGDTRSALRKMTGQYTMTWVYETPVGKLFPRTKVTKGTDLDDAYIIQGRKYEIMHFTENKNTVIVELIESYPDPDTGKVYRTPLVLVLEMKNGKIETGRHYCDPRLSYRHLTPAQVKKAFAGTSKPILVIE